MKTPQSYSHHQSQDPVPAGGPETFSGAHTSFCWLLDKCDQRKAESLSRNTIRYNRTLSNMKNVSFEGSLIPNTQVRDVGPCSRPTLQILVCHLPLEGNTFWTLWSLSWEPGKEVEGVGMEVGRGGQLLLPDSCRSHDNSQNCLETCLPIHVGDCWWQMSSCPETETP